MFQINNIPNQIMLISKLFSNYSPAFSIFGKQKLHPLFLKYNVDKYQSFVSIKWPLIRHLTIFDPDQVGDTFFLYIILPAWQLLFFCKMSAGVLKRRIKFLSCRAQNGSKPPLNVKDQQLCRVPPSALYKQIVLIIRRP